MSDLPRWYAMEAERLEAEIKRITAERDYARQAARSADARIVEAERLLRLCIPSLQKDGRPHVVVEVDAFLQSSPGAEQAETNGYSILVIYEMPDGTQERIVREGLERYRETSTDGLHWRRCL